MLAAEEGAHTLSEINVDDLSLHEGHGHDSSEGSGDHQHDLRGVWFGLVALSGIYFFFIMERLMAICMEQKRSKKVKTVSLCGSSAIFFETNALFEVV